MGRGLGLIRRSPPAPVRPAEQLSRPKQIPALGIRTLLPEVPPASPPLRLEGDEDIDKRLEYHWIREIDH